MMKQYRAYAKINLSLRILGKRKDGFHNLETLMAPLELCDELFINPASELSMSCDMPGVPIDESNLVMKAGRTMEKALGRCMHWHIHLVKHIPHGAGLGGGSSDAACALQALNQLSGNPLSLTQLNDLAATLGSDVNFFLYDSLCLCSGRGEKITPLDSTDWRPHLVLLKPSFGVSTPDAYKAWADARRLPGVLYVPQTVANYCMVNDLEVPVFEKYPFLAVMKHWLIEQPDVQAAMMSGSGSTMFAVVGSVTQARQLIVNAKEHLDPHLWAWTGGIHQK